MIICSNLHHEDDGEIHIDEAGHHIDEAGQEWKQGGTIKCNFDANINAYSLIVQRFSLI
jgi:hypothetical protein